MSNGPETSPAAPETESAFNQLFCDEVGGEQETRHNYTYSEGQASYVVVDCETPTMVWEGGLDRRSSLDSVQQALFFSAITGKKPGVVIYDTDNELGPIEYQIRIAAELAGVQYVSYDWQEGLEEAPAEEVMVPDLPDFAFDFGW